MFQSPGPVSFGCLGVFIVLGSLAISGELLCHRVMISFPVLFQADCSVTCLAKYSTRRIGPIPGIQTAPGARVEIVGHRVIPRKERGKGGLVHTIKFKGPFGCTLFSCHDSHCMHGRGEGKKNKGNCRSLPVPELAAGGGRGVGLALDDVIFKLDLISSTWLALAHHAKC